MEQATEKQVNFAKKLGIDNPGQYDKNNLRVMIDNALNKDEPKPQVIKPEQLGESAVPRTANGTAKLTTMYTSYAKDVFIALMSKEGGTASEDRTLAIDIVKTFRDAFS